MVQARTNTRPDLIATRLDLITTRHLGRISGTMIHRKIVPIVLAIAAVAVAACESAGDKAGSGAAAATDSTQADSAASSAVSIVPGGLTPPESAGVSLGSQPKQPPAAATPIDSGPSYERMAGYVVRGTDESSFRRCGSTQTHLLRPRGEANALILQRYRFKAPTPLTPVYFVFREARIIHDTVVVGDNTYLSVVDVRAVVPEQPEVTPECPTPGRGSMISR